LAVVAQAALAIIHSLIHPFLHLKVQDFEVVILPRSDLLL
jgi:hypothetical protein